MNANPAILFWTISGLFITWLAWREIREVEK